MAGARVHVGLAGELRTGLGHEALDPVQERGELSIAQLRHRPPRVDALDPQTLAGPHRPDPGEVALVEQARRDEVVSAAQPSGAQVGDRAIAVPVLAEDIGAEVSDEGGLVVGADQVEPAEA